MRDDVELIGVTGAAWIVDINCTFDGFVVNNLGNRLLHVLG